MKDASIILEYRKFHMNKNKNFFESDRTLEKIPQKHLKNLLWAIRNPSGCFPVQTTLVSTILHALTGRLD